MGIRAEIIALGFCLASWPLLSAAVSQEDERQALLTAVNEVVRDPGRYQKAIEAGRERILLCTQCHGEDGNSKGNGVPNLAGQNPTYLLEQIEKFSDGRRKNFVMQSLARSFTLEDKVNIALFYSSMKVKAVPADPVLASEGSRIYNSVCLLCHGSDGRGEAGYARLAGQQVDYVVATLKRFRDNARHLTAESDMKRHNTRMEQVTQNLTDRDIEALANYIALQK